MDRAPPAPASTGEAPEQYASCAVCFGAGFWALGGVVGACLDRDRNGLLHVPQPPDLMRLVLVELNSNGWPV